MSEPKKFLVGGEWRTSGSTIPVTFPYNGETVAEIYEPADSDLEDAMQASVRGFEVMRKMPAYQRTEILEGLHKQMEARGEDLVQAMVHEGGKTLTVARGELTRAKMTVKLSAEEARRVPGEMVSMDWAPPGENRLGMVRRFPVGPVLGITPFNYPLNLACHKIGPAIAVGSSIILKPDPVTPLSSLILGEMLLDAGLPPGALSILPCYGERAEQLVRDDRLAVVSFTGSSAVGWYLRSIAGRKKVSLELGGNAPAIIHEDADLSHASKRIAVGGFTNAGQNCISVQRVMVHRPVYHEMVETMLDEIKQLKVGDPREETTDVGPMIKEEAAVRAESWVQEAKEQGAQEMLGGARQGTMFPPTVLADITGDMKVSCQEVFAPVITVSPYDAFTDALTAANDTEYGLQAGVFTRDMGRIMQAHETIEVGGLQINEVSTFRMDHMPYGGVKASGLGREGVKYAIEEMTEPRLMVINNR